MKRLIVSDTHIGSRFCRKKELISLLKEKKYDQLILNGDIIEFLKIPTFTPLVIELMRSIDYSKEIIYIIGNHDTSLTGFIGETFKNIKFVKEYCFEEGGRKFRIEHGDKYENGIVHSRTLMKIISIFQDTLEKIFNVNLGVWYSKLKFNKRKIKRLWDIMDQNNDVDVLIVGHTHVPEVLIWIDEQEDIKTYVNTGDWISHATYVEINNGVVRLRNFLKKSNF
jgi:UDP-2,3-diacylglucosamine pyrophosphatase LpxH